MWIKIASADCTDENAKGGQTKASDGVKTVTASVTAQMAETIKYGNERGSANWQMPVGKDAVARRVHH